jgi:redox-sensitive bicupin YhaK (pirin superfamily)
MIRKQSAEDRGGSRLGWLDSRFSFSFADYHDPQQMGFRSLRVLNEDWIAPASGFGPHPHRDMEILTYPISGELLHRDSLGGESRLTAGRIQLMTAGTGIVHAEENSSDDEAHHLLQIWLRPDRAGHTPKYQERDIDLALGGLQPLVSPDGRDGTLEIHQDATIHRLGLPAGSLLEHALATGRHAWLQLVRGEVGLNDIPLCAGDGAAVSGESVLRLAAKKDAEGLLFDLA